MGLSSLWPLSSIEMYFSLVPSMDAALTWLTFAARLAATSSEASSGLVGSEMCIRDSVALEAPHDLPVALSPPPGPLGVLGGLGVAHDPLPRDLVQRAVRLPVAAPVEPVPHGLAARGGDGAGAAYRRERRLGAQPARVEARPVGRRPLHRDAGRLPGRGDRPGERLVARRVGGELAGQDLAAPPVQDVQPVRVGVGVDPAEDRPAGVGYRFVLHASLRSFRARLDRADGTLTGRDRMRLFGSAVSLHAPIRSCGGLGSPRPARDMSGNEGSPVGASGMWGHRAVRI